MLLDAYKQVTNRAGTYQVEGARNFGTLNIGGGTLAMGHALGATGGMLIATLLDEMERSDVQFGVVAIMGGAGLGTATVLECI
jgi:acetyl-CoA C-acetyltransferase